MKICRIGTIFISETSSASSFFHSLGKAFTVPFLAILLLLAAHLFCPCNKPNISACFVLFARRFTASFKRVCPVRLTLRATEICCNQLFLTNTRFDYFPELFQLTFLPIIFYNKKYSEKKGGSPFRMEDVALKTILQALKEHSEHIDSRFDHLEKRMDGLEARMDKLESRMDKMESRMDKLESRMDKLENDLQSFRKNVDERFTRLEKKLEGIRAELTDAQETLDFVSSKTLKHEKKLRQL